MLNQNIVSDLDCRRVLKGIYDYFSRKPDGFKVEYLRYMINSYHKFHIRVTKGDKILSVIADKTGELRGSRFPSVETWYIKRNDSGHVEEHPALSTAFACHAMSYTFDELDNIIEDAETFFNYEEIDNK